MELQEFSLKTFREKAKLTQGELADMIGTKQAVVSNIERGGFIPSIYMAIRIVDALSTRGVFVTLEDLFVYRNEGKMKANSANQPVPSAM